MLGELNPCGGGDSIPLLQEKLLVGRRSACDICLAYPNVSSHHCEFELKNGYWHIRDLGSSNGIRINGERTDAGFLMPGDEVQISKHRFRIEYTVLSDAPAPEQQNPFAMGLLEKAGLEVENASRRVPRSSKSDSSRKNRNSSRDDFIMQWLDEE